MSASRSRRRGSGWVFTCFLAPKNVRAPVRYQERNNNRKLILVGQIRSIAGSMRTALRNTDTAQAAYVARHTAIERFGNALSVLRIAQLMSIVRIGKERDFRQNRRHVGADQHD